MTLVFLQSGEKMIMKKDAVKNELRLVMIKNCYNLKEMLR